MAATTMQAYDKYGAPLFINKEEEISTGTSIIACTFDGGVMIGADSRTSSGIYVSNRVADKLTRITDNIYCCRSGSAADTQAIADIVAYHLDFYKAETGEEPKVETAAAIFQELCYKYKEQLLAAVIVAGWDGVNGSQVYSIPLGGMCFKQKLAVGGSGSTFIYGYIDANFKQEMSEAECRQFMTNTLALAMSRDGSSGGVIRLGTIRPGKPIEREIISGVKIPKFSQD
uniref:proteasome endopeptidase complex n=1 Tax=Panstrongylus lignarius TaxID=156445 RepID=A0A224XVW8_9HEMI